LHIIRPEILEAFYAILSVCHLFVSMRHMPYFRLKLPKV
jgi:hypothetical protein